MRVREKNFFKGMYNNKSDSTVMATPPLDKVRIRVLQNVSPAASVRSYPPSDVNSIMLY